MILTLSVKKQCSFCFLLAYYYFCNEHDYFLLINMYDYERTYWPTHCIVFLDTIDAQGLPCAYTHIIYIVNLPPRLA